jgi:hypothetical protein
MLWLIQKEFFRFLNLFRVSAIQSPIFYLSNVIRTVIQADNVMNQTFQRTNNISTAPGIGVNIATINITEDGSYDVRGYASLVTTVLAGRGVSFNVNDETGALLAEFITFGTTSGEAFAFLPIRLLLKNGWSINIVSQSTYAAGEQVQGSVTAIKRFQD